MMELTPEQAEDLRELHCAGETLAADLVVIGATAYRIFVDDPYRTTEDVDIAIALDLDAWPEFVSQLLERGWTQRQNLEHRWRGSHGSLVDIIPAGSKLREQGRLVWPKSEMTMSLSGFDHVFADSIERELAPGLRIKVVPLPVLALLKIFAFRDNPHGRRKDGEDLVELLERYEQDGDRRFTDAILDAGLSFEDAGAFLLGMDLRRLCKPDEAERLEHIVSQMAEGSSLAFVAFGRLLPGADDSDDAPVEQLLAAFTLGLRRDRDQSLDSADP